MKDGIHDPDGRSRPNQSIMGFLNDWPEMHTLRLEIEHLRSQTARIPMMHDEIARSHMRVEQLRKDARHARDQARTLRRELTEIHKGQLRAESRHRNARRELQRYRRQNARLEAEIREMAESESYKIGHRLVRLAKFFRPASSGAAVDSVEPTEHESTPAARTDAVIDEELSVAKNSTLEPNPKGTPCVLIDARGCERNLTIEALKSLPDSKNLRRVLVLDSHDFDLAYRWNMCLEYIPPLVTERSSDIDTEISPQQRRWTEVMAEHQPQEIYRPYRQGASSRSRLRLEYFAPLQIS